MEKPERLTKRWWLRERDEIMWSLERWPLLRHLIVEPRFRWAWFIVFGMCLILGAAVPRIWIASPPETIPIVRVSLIDMVEANLYKNMALRAQAGGEPQRAFGLWRTALHNNPADLSVIRGSISNALLLPPRNSAHIGTAVRNCFWLLQLTHTNRADLDFALGVYERFGADDLVLYSLQQASPLNSYETEAGCRALIRIGDATRYHDIRPQLGAAAEGGLLELYDAVYDAAWGVEPEIRSEGVAKLERVAKSGDPARSPDALKLLLIAHRSVTNAVAYGATLDKLHDLHRDEPLQHAAYWRLLSNTGRSEDAVAFARKYAEPPINSTEVLRISETFILLGLVDDAINYLEKFAPEVGVNGDVWVNLTDLLIAEKRWADLRRVAAEMRSHNGARGVLGGYTYYLEGYALRAEGGDQDASVAFDLVPSGNIRDSELVLKVASKLLEFGAPAPARRLLEQIQRTHVSNPVYWAQFVRTAHALKDSALMLEVAGKGYDSAPSDPTSVNNLVAAMIINRTSPDRLLGLATFLYGMYPQELPVKMNYSLALIQSGRADDALAILDTITDAAPDKIEGTMLAFARAEAFMVKGDRSAALTNALAVNTSFLLPIQVERIEALKSPETEPVEAEPVKKGK